LRYTRKVRADVRPIPTPHPSEVIVEEIEARGWSRDDLATAMMAADDDNWGLHRLSVDLYLECGPDDPHLLMGSDGAEGFARAFGTSVDLWRNLERQWLNTREEK
jgi:hypothetical protein